MVKHVVTFQFSGSPSERMALSTSFREALVQLPYVIPELKSIEVGINENPVENGTCASRHALNPWKMWPFTQPIPPIRTP